MSDDFYLIIKTEILVFLFSKKVPFLISSLHSCSSFCPDPKSHTMAEHESGPNRPPIHLRRSKRFPKISLTDTRTSKLHSGVAPAQRFDEAALLRYAQAHVEGFPASPARFTVSQFTYGQSNSTFVLEVAGDDGKVKRYVLRKKPPGVLESAHAVEREFKVCETLVNLVKFCHWM